MDIHHKVDLRGIQLTNLPIGVLIDSNGQLQKAVDSHILHAFCTHASTVILRGEKVHQDVINSSWPHAFARIMAREDRAAHGPNSRDCWSPGEPARVQPPFPQDIWTLSCSVIRLALIGAGVLARIWSISNN